MHSSRHPFKGLHLFRGSQQVLGIDLAGSTGRDTGVCMIETMVGNKDRFYIRLLATVHTDEEIMDIIKRSNPMLVAIDAPLSLPKGRRHILERNDVHYRDCDLALRRLGIRFFPITLGPMRKLTERGIGLAKAIRRQGLKVIEVYPGASYDILGIPRKDKNSILSFFKNKTDFIRKKLHQRTLPTQDELDSLMCAYTGFLYLHGRTRLLGRGHHIVVPEIR